MEGIRVASEYVHSRGVTVLYLMTVVPYSRAGFLNIPGLNFFG